MRSVIVPSLRGRGTVGVRRGSLSLGVLPWAKALIPPLLMAPAPLTTSGSGALASRVGHQCLAWGQERLRLHPGWCGNDKTPSPRHRAFPEGHWLGSICA